MIHYDQAPQCEFIHAHPELVQRIQQTLPDEGVLCDLADLVKFRREGKAVFYSLADEHVRTIISNGMEHVLE